MPTQVTFTTTLIIIIIVIVIVKFGNNVALFSLSEDSKRLPHSHTFTQALFSMLFPCKCFLSNMNTFILTMVK